MNALAALISSLENGKVRLIRPGLFSTAVVSSFSGGPDRCGLASTLHSADCPGKFGGESAEGKPVSEIAALAVSGRGPEVSLGMAAINSALPRGNYLELNAEDLIIRKGSGKRIAVIGHFPFSESLKEKAGTLRVSELEPKSPEDISPEEMEKFLPSADVAAITALTLMNGTFERIISLCRKDCFRILLGPSAPLSPILLDYVDAVCGTLVSDIPALIEDVSAGRNFRRLRGKKLVCLSREARS